MLVIGVAGTELTAQERDWLQHDAVAGVILFKRNFASRDQVADLSAAIRAAAVAGASAAGGAEVIEVAGRARAIEEALRRADGSNVVAILGKGHERGQILADRTVDFDDMAETRAAWARLHREGDADA